MKIIQLSDIHFGTENETLLEGLYQTMQAHNPDLIVISGDFTQVASNGEFQKAKAFMDALSAPVFAVPGNHDIPRYNLWERFSDPYRKYRHYITPDLCPVLRNDQMVMVGLNTARRILPDWNWANGAVSRIQLDFLEKSFKGVEDQIRICVLHHPLHKAEGVGLDVRVYGARRAMRKIEELNINLVLSGHVHHASITQIGKTVYASASTAISTRLRYQENGFNIITIYPKSFEICHFTHDGTQFIQTNLRQFDCC